MRTRCRIPPRSPWHQERKPLLRQPDVTAHHVRPCSTADTDFTVGRRFDKPHQATDPHSRTVAFLVQVVPLSEREADWFASPLEPITTPHEK